MYLAVQINNTSYVDCSVKIDALVYSGKMHKLPIMNKKLSRGVFLSVNPIFDSLANMSRSIFSADASAQKHTEAYCKKQ